MLVAQLCLTLWPPKGSLPGSSVHGVLQARILEWVAIPFSRGFSRPREGVRVSHIAGRFFTVWAPREAWLLYWQADSFTAELPRKPALTAQVYFLHAGTAVTVSWVSSSNSHSHWGRWMMPTDSLTLFPLWIGVCVPSPGIWMAPRHLWSIDYGRSADRLPLSWLWKPWLLHTHSWGTQTPHKRFACSARATMGRALRLQRGMGPPPTVPHGASDPAENKPSRIPAPHPGVIPVTPLGSEYCAAEPT